MLKSAHARISEIIVFFIVWCKDDEKYMTVGIHPQTTYLLLQLTDLPTFYLFFGNSELDRHSTKQKPPKAQNSTAPEQQYPPCLTA